MRTARALFIAATALACPAPHESSAAEQAPGESAPEPLPEGFTKLRFAVTRFLSLAQIEEAYGPVTNYLSRQLGVSVELYAPEGYEASGDAIGRGEADIADLAPLAYVRAKVRYPHIRPFLALIADGSPTYAGYIVVRAASPYETLSDLKGKKLAFVDVDSSSGYLYPSYLLRERGIDPRTFFSSVTFYGTHDRVLDAVLKGEVDVGATYSKALAYTRNRGVNPMDYRIIAKTPRIPNDVICARHDLPRSVVDNVAAALLSLTTLTQEGRDVLGRSLQVNGFVRAGDEHYAGVREIAMKMGAMDRD